MSRLLVVGVFPAGGRTRAWLSLQSRFVADTCLPDTDHRFVGSNLDPGPFGDRLVANLPGFVSPAEDRARLTAAALDYCVSRPAFDYYLVLDADAFPCRRGWLPAATWLLEPVDGLPRRRYAAPCRCENLETWPHPGVLFFDAPYLRASRALFDTAPATAVNLAGQTVSATGVSFPREAGGRPVWLPMLRANAANPHPVHGGVYAGLFYHHNGGSLPLTFASVRANLFHAAVNRNATSVADQALLAELVRAPRALLANLLDVEQGAL